MHLDALRDLLHARAFALGLAFGGVGVLVTGTLAVVSRRRLPDLAGILCVVAAWLAIRGAWGDTLANGQVLLSLGVLAVGGAVVVLVSQLSRAAAEHPLVVTAVTVTPGAVLLAHSAPLAGSGLSRTILAVATVAIAVAIRDFDAIWGPRGAPWLLFAVAAGGVYLAVPDTELARALLGVALPFALLSIPRPTSPIGPAGSAALAGLFTWVVVVGGRGRPGSVVGGLAVIGILAAEPLGRRTIGSIVLGSRFRYDRNRDEWITIAVMCAVAQFVIALYASRVVAHEDAAVSALVILAPVALIAILVSPMLYQDLRPNQQPRRRAHHRRPMPPHRLRLER